MSTKENTKKGDVKEEDLPDQTEEEMAKSDEIRATEFIENLQEQIELLKNKLLRSLAECENLRTRESKRVAEARDYSIVSFAKDLVSITDNLTRALEHVPENLEKDVQVVIDGIEMTKTEFDNVFKKHGLESIEPKQGEMFDYNKHNAISQISAKDFKEGSIVSTMQVGYKIKDRLLRPAAVVVAKK